MPDSNCRLQLFEKIETMNGD